MWTKEERNERRLTTCKHFTGIQNQACEKGVAYESVKDADSSPYRWACLSDDIPCSLREYPTQDDIDAEDAEIAKSLKRVSIARKAIVEHTQGKRGVTGTIDCPICESGKLQFSVAGVNGHIHAMCNTTACVSWME